MYKDYEVRRQVLLVAGLMSNYGKKVASILEIKGRVSEAQEIERRIASMAEVVFDEGEE